MGCIPKALKQFQVTPRPTHPQPNLESPRWNPEATNRVAVRRYPGAPARFLIRSPNCKRKPKLAGIGRRSRCKMGPPADDEGVPWPRRVRLSGLVPYHLSTATQRPLGCQALQEEESFFWGGHRTCWTHQPKASLDAPRVRFSSHGYGYGSFDPLPHSTAYSDCLGRPCPNKPNTRPMNLHWAHIDNRDGGAVD